MCGPVRQPPVQVACLPKPRLVPGLKRGQRHEISCDVVTYEERIVPSQIRSDEPVAPPPGEVRKGSEGGAEVESRILSSEPIESSVNGIDTARSGPNRLLYSHTTIRGDTAVIAYHTQ